ncbi:MAG: right-handed parallel beta-helix repeat-containing protein [Candidatus Methylarchaceae archaeon HK02M2]|nr:right-handed parallel beta-helix repeat-containing protein [Candidatus Methylarchaceae archaeon HK02M2]
MKKMIATVTIAMLLMLPLLLVIPLPAIAEPTEALSDAVGGGTGGIYYLDPTILYTGGVTITGDTTIYGRGAVIDLDGDDLDIVGAYLYIERCTITNGENGLHFEDDATGFVYNNIIVQNSDDGIDMDDCDEGEIVIKENSIIQNYDGVDFNDSTNIIILENMITHNEDDGIDGNNYYLMWDEGEGCYLPEVNDLHNIVIKGNKIIGNGDEETGDGIELEFVNGVSIASNLIAGNEEDGIDFDDSFYNDRWFGSCPVASVINNKILANDNQGIEYDGDDDWPEVDTDGDGEDDTTVILSLTISQNKIMGNNEEGIEIDDTKNIVITYNEIMGNEDEGIEIDGTDEFDVDFMVENILIAYNSIIDNNGENIDLDEVSDVKIIFNKITGSADEEGINIDGGYYLDSPYYVDVYGEDLLIKGNVITGNEEEGIEVENFDSPVVIEWNTILYNGHEGIHLDDVESPQILHNTVMYQYDESEETRPGIELDECDGARIAYNTVAYNVDTNVRVDDSDDVIIEHNTIIGSEDRGVVVNDCEDMTIQYNEIYFNQEHGIEWDYSSGLINHNIIGYTGSLSGNKNGIDLWDSCSDDDNLVTISDNTIMGNENGIECTDSDPTIIGNYIAYNEDGIVIIGGNNGDCNVTIGGTYNNRNYIIRNFDDGIYVSAGADVPIINYNNIFENVEYGVQYGGENIIDAENNWWGDISGPGDPATFGFGPGIGDEVSELVDYSPWLVSVIP